MKLKKLVPINDSDTINELMGMFADHFEYAIKDISSYEELTEEEKGIIPRWIFDLITEPDDWQDLTKQRKIANFKILTRLSQIIDQFPFLRFHQILWNYGITRKGEDKFGEESIITLRKLEENMSRKQS